jgi:ThiS family
LATVRVPDDRRSLATALTRFTGVELDAADIRQLLRALGERYPDLKPHLADGVAIAIDGEIFQDARLEPIPIARCTSSRRSWGADDLPFGHRRSTKL